MNNSTILPKCATATQMITRQAFLFRSNVYVNDLIAVVTLILSIQVGKVLTNKSFFTSSTHVLIWISLMIMNIHEWVYGFIQNWSLYRSFVYSTEPCSIMFNEYECFPWYTANIFVRLLLLFTNCALTSDRLLTLLVPRIPSSYLRGIILFLISLIVSVVFCIMLTSDGPTEALQSNCFQRMNRNIDELKSQVLFYFKVCLACLVLNVFAWIFNWRSSRNKKFILQEQYSKRENMNSAIVISLILFFQIVALGFYSLSVVYILDIYEFVDQIVMTNLVLWFYTYPWAALSLPAGIMMSTRFITTRRRRQVDVMTTENQKEDQESYFIKLNQSWGSGMSRNSQVVPVG